MASEKHEKSKLAKHIPKDAQVICSILKEIGVTDYEPRVINQLLEFTYREPRFVCALLFRFNFLF
jgi:transcription initiation factor TFIID subunit 9B